MQIRRHILILLLIIHILQLIVVCHAVAVENLKGVPVSKLEVGDNYAIRTIIENVDFREHTAFMYPYSKNAESLYGMEMKEIGEKKKVIAYAKDASGVRWKVRFEKENGESATIDSEGNLTAIAKGVTAFSVIPENMLSFNFPFSKERFDFAIARLVVSVDEEGEYPLGLQVPGAPLNVLKIEGDSVETLFVPFPSCAEMSKVVVELYDESHDTDVFEKANGLHVEDLSEGKFIVRKKDSSKDASGVVVAKIDGKVYGHVLITSGKRIARHEGSARMEGLYAVNGVVFVQQSDRLRIPKLDFKDGEYSGKEITISTSLAGTATELSSEAEYRKSLPQNTFQKFASYDDYYTVRSNPSGDGPALYIAEYMDDKLDNISRQLRPFAPAFFIVHLPKKTEFVDWLPEKSEKEERVLKAGAIPAGWRTLPVVSGYDMGRSYNGFSNALIAMTKPGETRQLYSEDDIVFVSLDEKVATVTENGLVRAVGFGNTRIRAERKGSVVLKAQKAFYRENDEPLEAFNIFIIVAPNATTIDIEGAEKGALRVSPSTRQREFRLKLSNEKADITGLKFFPIRYQKGKRSFDEHGSVYRLQGKDYNVSVTESSDDAMIAALMDESQGIHHGLFRFVPYGAPERYYWENFVNKQGDVLFPVRDVRVGDKFYLPKLSTIPASAKGRIRFVSDYGMNGISRPEQTPFEECFALWANGEIEVLGGKNLEDGDVYVISTHVGPAVYLIFRK